MSRAYRIRVQESLHRVIRASDHVSTDLELLDILPPEQMSELLALELQKRGFERDGLSVVKQQNGVTITIDLESATVTVEVEDHAEVDLEASREGVADTDWSGSRSAQSEARLRKAAQEELETQASGRESILQRQVTNRLEKELGNIRQDLDEAVNRATAAALKQRAAEIGQIKEMTEDPETGSLTIVVEV